MEVSLTHEEANYMFAHEEEVNEQLTLILSAGKGENWGLMAECIAVLNAFSFRLGTQYKDAKVY